MMGKHLAQVNIGGTFGSPFGVTKNAGDLISLILNIAFVVSGVLILIMFLVAGFQMVMGAGQNNPESAKKGKQAASSALLGFVIVFVAYWIVRLIEIIVGVRFLTMPGI